MIQTLILGMTKMRRTRMMTDGYTQIHHLQIQLNEPKATHSVKVNCPSSSSQHNWSAAATDDTSDELPQLLLSPHIYLGWLDHICLCSKKRDSETNRLFNSGKVQWWYSRRSVLSAFSALSMASYHLLEEWSIEDSWFLVMGAMKFCLREQRYINPGNDLVRSRKVQATMTLMWDVHRAKDMQVPDIAFTTVDLPWATCPIVPNQREITSKIR